MWQIYKKEIVLYFSSLIAYIVIGSFLVFLGLFIWVFQDTSVLEYNFATLDQLFTLAPFIFIFLIPAIAMSSISDEKASGTIEILATKPILNRSIVLGKFFAIWTLTGFAILPTILYYYSLYQLGSPKGNLDSGAIFGSYIGLLFLAGAFSSIGLFASSITRNQIVAFVSGAFLCFFFHWAFFYLSKLPVFFGKMEYYIQQMGIDYHYNSISRGVVDTRDLVYFISVVILFLFLTSVNLNAHKK
jgi:ABC-2 type transport system permease protein